MSLRNERVRKELMRDISEIIHREIRGLEGVVSIVDVEVSHDNSFAKVIYSVLGSPEQIEKDKEVIEKNTGRIRYEVGKRLGSVEQQKFAEEIDTIVAALDRQALVAMLEKLANGNTYRNFLLDHALITWLSCSDHVAIMHR